MIGNGLARDGQAEIRPHAAAAAAHDLMLVRMIEIDEQGSIGKRGIKAQRAAHIRLLPDGEEGFQIREIVSVQGQHGHGQRHADAVVRAQGGSAAGGEGIARDRPGDRIVFEVVAGGAGIDADHIQMGLEQYGGGVGVGTGLADEYVAHGVKASMEAESRRPVDDRSGKGLLVSASMGDLADQIKVAEHGIVTQGIQCNLFHIRIIAEEKKYVNTLPC